MIAVEQGVAADGACAPLLNAIAFDGQAMDRLLTTLIVVTSAVSALSCSRRTTGAPNPGVVNRSRIVESTPDAKELDMEAKIYIFGDFSSEDLDAITTMVKQEDTSPLLSIVRQGETTEVKTGAFCGVLCGHGRIFILKKVGVRWTITGRLTWDE